MGQRRCRSLGTFDGTDWSCQARCGGPSGRGVLGSPLPADHPAATRSQSGTRRRRQLQSCRAPSGGGRGRGSVPSTYRLPSVRARPRVAVDCRHATPSRCGRASPAPTPSSKARTTTPNYRHTTMMGTPRCSARAATSARRLHHARHACSKAPPRGVRSLGTPPPCCSSVLMALRRSPARACLARRLSIARHDMYVS